jgi:hypothetical protein
MQSYRITTPVIDGPGLAIMLFTRNETVTSAKKMSSSAWVKWRRGAAKDSTIQKTGIEIRIAVVIKTALPGTHQPGRKSGPIFGDNATALLDGTLM